MPIRRASGSTQTRGPATARPRDPHVAGVRALEARDHPQQRRLARAARAEHGEEAAALEPQVDAVDREPAVEAAREPVRLDRRLDALLGGRRGVERERGLIHAGGNSDGSGRIRLP